MVCVVIWCDVVVLCWFWYPCFCFVCLFLCVLLDAKQHHPRKGIYVICHNKRGPQSRQNSMYVYTCITATDYYYYAITQSLQHLHTTAAPQHAQIKGTRATQHAHTQPATAEPATTEEPQRASHQPPGQRKHISHCGWHDIYMYVCR